MNPTINNTPLQYRSQMSTGSRWGILCFAFALVIFVGYVQLPEAILQAGEVRLSQSGQLAIGVLLFALILWMTEVVPFHITGLLGLVLLSLFRVDSFSSLVVQGFGNHIVLFFLGILILSSFITRSGLGTRISVLLLGRTGNSTSAIILGFLIVGMILSMWITNTAVAAMLMPLGVSILKGEGLKPLKSTFGKGLMIACAWGPIIGGIMAPSGAGPNPIAIGFLEEMAGIDLGFAEWMLFGVPAGLLILFPTWWLLILFFPPEIKHLSKSTEELKQASRELPPMNRDEILTLIIFVLTIILWLTSSFWENLLGISIPISLPVLLSTLLFFLPNLSKTGWDIIEKDISWSSILLIVTGISLGTALYQSGAANWLANIFLSGIANTPAIVMVLLIVLVVSFLKIFLSSNTVTATIIIPILITLSTSIGVDTIAITIPAAITASMSFILVTSTPTNVIPYTSGYFSIRDMAVAGTVMTIIAAPIVALTIFVIGRLTGLY